MLKMPCFAAALAAVLALVLVAPAAATTKVRIEWLQLAASNEAQPATFYAEQTLSTTGSTPATSNAAPAFPGSGRGVARITIISGAAVVAWGDNPTAGEANGIRLQAGDEKDVFLTAGQLVSFVEAADGPSGSAGGTVTTQSALVTYTDRGGTITTGGTSQTLAVLNASRKSLYVQNLCSATEDLYVSSTGNATTSGAGDDADIAPCGSWALSFNGTVPSQAITVIAATTGHRFIAKEGQ